MKFKLFFSVIILFFVFKTNISFSQANAGTDQEICTNHTNLNGNLPPSGFYGTWSIMQGSCIFANENSNSTFVNGLGAGENILRWTFTNGDPNDDTFDDVSIINNKTTIANTAGDEEVCQNFHILNANIFGSGETGLWTVVEGGGIIANPSQNTTNITVIPQGINKYEWKISRGICSSKDTLIITNNEVVANAGTNVTTCNDFVTLDADNPPVGIGTWSVVSGTADFDNINTYNTTASNLGVNLNSLQWTVVNGGCSDYDNVIITSNKPTDAFAGTDKIICSNTTNLSANNPIQGNGSWTLSLGTGSFTYPNNYNSQVTGVGQGSNIYKWSITKNGCLSEDEVEIFYDYFVANAGADDITCTNSYILNGNNPGTGTGEWRVTGGSGTFVNENQYNTEVSGLVNGVNTFEWKITKGACVETDYVSISRNTASPANAGSDFEICNGNTTLAASNPSVGTGSWSVISGTGIFANSLLNTTSVSNVSFNANTYRWTINYAECSNYDDVIVTNNFVNANAGIDQIVCGTSSILNGNEAQTGEIGEWQIIAGASTVTNINQYNSTVTSLTSGINKYRWTLTKGMCSDFDDIEILNNQYIANASVSGPTEICESYSPINGNMPPLGGNGFWTVQPTTAFFDNSNDQTTTVRNLSLGSNIIKWTLAKDGCENSDEAVINRNTVLANAGNDQNICLNYTSLAALPVSGSLSGIWSVSGGSGTINEPSNNTSDVTGLSIGLNTFTWTVSGNGCTDDDNVIITNNMFFTLAGPNQQICDDNTNLNANNPNPDSGYWTVVSGTGIFNNSSQYNTSVSGILENSVNIYRWHVTKNSCTATDDVNITNNLVQANAGADITVCTNYADLDAETPILGTGNWTVQFGAGAFSDENSPNSQVNNINPGENIYRWTVTNNTCISFDDVSVFNNSIEVYAGSDQEICVDYTQLSGGQPPAGETGVWEIVSGYADFEDISLYNTNITNIQRGYNTLKWKIFNSGCTSNEDEVIIHNRSFDAVAGEDQVLDNFVTSTFMTAVLPSGATAQWTPVGGGGIITDIYNPNTEVTEMPSGVNQFLWSVIKDGCPSDDIVNITVVNFAPNAGVDRTICSDSVQLSAGDYGASNQVWSVLEGAGNFVDIHSNNTWVRNVGVGMNIYRWTVTQNGATSYDDVSITRIIADAGEDQYLSSRTVTLDGNMPPTGANGVWSLIMGSGNIVSPTLYNSQVHNIAYNNTFMWTISSSSCTTEDYVDVYYDGTGINELDDKFLIYPNPNSGEFIIENIEEESYDMEIFDIIGKLIYNETKIRKKVKKINLLNEKPGIYFMKILKNNKKRVIKIIIK